MATLLTVLALVAVAGLTPMKTVEPFVIRVDNSTGVVDVVPVLKGKAPSAGSGDALLRHAVRDRRASATCGSLAESGLRDRWARITRRR